jgi:hypothetical protein
MMKLITNDNSGTCTRFGSRLIHLEWQERLNRPSFSNFGGPQNAGRSSSLSTRSLQKKTQPALRSSSPVPRNLEAE